MAEIYESDIICPFFKTPATNGSSRNRKSAAALNREKKKKIVCEGLQKDSVLTQEFKSREERDKHKESFCASLCWRGCPIAIALMETKYNT